MDSERAGCPKSYGFRVCTLYTHNKSTEKKEGGGGKRLEEGRRKGGKQEGHPSKPVMRRQLVCELWVS